MHSDRVSTTAGDGGRKSSKPIMEKKRRARINASLAELKSLLLEAIKKEGSRHSKMEKADILELTVKHLRQTQRHPLPVLPAGSDPSSLSKYRQLGFNECLQEASRYLSSVDSCDVELRTRLLNHLANCITGYGDDPPTSPSTTTTSHSPTSPMTSRSMTSPSPPPPLHPARVGGEAVTSGFATSPTTPMTAPRSEPSVCAGAAAPRVVVSSGSGGSSSVPRILSSDLSSNTVIVQGGGAGASGGGLGVTMIPSQVAPPPPPQPLQMGKIFSGIQVYPAKLASGEIAFVVPANMLASQTSSSYVIPVYASQTVVSTSSNPVPSEASSSSSLVMMSSAASAVPVTSIPSMAPVATQTVTAAASSSTPHASLPVSPASLPVSVTQLPPGVISLSTPGALGVASPGILSVSAAPPVQPPPPPPLPPPASVFSVASLVPGIPSTDTLSPARSAFLPPLSLSGASPSSSVVSGFPADSSGMVQEAPKTFLASPSFRPHVPLAAPFPSLPKVVVLQGGPQQSPHVDTSSAGGDGGSLAVRRLAFEGEDHQQSGEDGESSGAEPVWRPW